LGGRESAILHEYGRDLRKDPQKPLEGRTKEVFETFRKRFRPHVREGIRGCR